MPLQSVILNPVNPSQLDCNCIKRLQVVNAPLGGTMIAWELPNGFREKGSYHFFVDVGRSGTTEWEPLNQVPVVDDCVYMDHKQRYYDQMSDIYYRVRLVLPSVIDPATGKCKVCISQPYQANGAWSKRDWLIAREITRKEYLMQRKRTNMTAVGFVLKRRKWGQPCSVCTEYDSGEVQAECPQCFSTGFTGGYFKVVDFTLTMGAPWGRKFKRDEQVSVTNNIARKGRGVSYPYLDTNDVFIRRDSGERFYVNNIEQLAEIGGIPLIVGVEIRLAPTTDLIYTIPTYGGSSSSVPAAPPDPNCPSSSSSSSSSSPAPDCDYRTGLDNGEGW